MGEDLRCKQDRQFKCLGDRRFIEEMAPDLFAAIPAREQVRVTAVATEYAAKPGDLLLADVDLEQRVASLRHGAAVAARMSGASVVDLAARLEGGGYLRVVSHDDGVLEAQVCAPRGRRDDRP